MKVLTMTKVLGDIDTVALMGYNEAPDKCQYVREYCRENYGAANGALVGAVLYAFRDTAKIYNGSSGNRKSIGTEALY